jgi:hypothetical protein
LGADCPIDDIKDRIADLLASKSLVVLRRKEKAGRTKELDVRRYLKNVSLSGRSVTVECIVSPEGTIRVDEMMKLLQLDENGIAGPVRRLKVLWNEI